MNGIRSAKGLSLVALFILLLSILSGCLQSSLQSSKNNGDTGGGEDFAFTTIDGTTKHLTDYRGKIVVLDLMLVIGCDPCLYQFLELKKISENYSNDNVVIISIDVNPYETAQDVQTTIDGFKQQLDIELDWIFGMDNGGIWEKYHINTPGGVPTLYIFDKNGNIYYSKEGYKPYSLLASKIDELLTKT